MHVLYVYTFLQIIFEALPVSSSGNVALWTPILQNLLNFNFAQMPLPDFDFLIHIPTVFVLALFFFKKWFPYVKNFYAHKKMLWHLACYYTAADAVTVALYFFWKYVGISFFPLWCGFLCTTVFLLSLQYAKKTQEDKLWYLSDALALGFAQGCALLPGISRLAITFTTAIWLGYSSTQALYCSFLLQLPLIGAGVLKALWGVCQHGGDPLLYDSTFYGVVGVATGIAFCFLQLLFGMVHRKTVWKFAWYTGALSLVAAVWGL